MIAPHCFSRQNILQLTLFLYAFAVVSFLLVYYCLPLSFELVHQKELIAGEATLNGIDISQRVGTAYRFLFGGTAFVLLVYGLFYYLWRKTAINFVREGELILVSVAIICLSFLQVIGTNCLIALKLLNAIFWLRIGMLLVLSCTGAAGQVLRNKMVFPLSLCYAGLLLFAAFFIRGGLPLIKEHPVWIFTALVLVILFFYAASGYFLRRSAEQTSLLLLPLAAIPVLSFLSLELLFYIREKQGHFIPFRTIFGSSFLLVFLALNAWFHFRQKRNKPVSLELLIRKVLGPSIVVSFVLLFRYRPVMQQQMELFEFGNMANPLTAVFQFGKIPFLDFTSSHMFSEQWFGYLYSFIFGYNTQFDFIVYAFLNELILFLVLYWFLNRVFHRPFVSLFIVLFFPLGGDVFYYPVFIGVIPLIFARKLIECPRPGTFFKLFLTILTLILWRIDTGSATLIASFLFFPLLWFIAREKFPVKTFFKGLSFFALLLLCGTGIVMLLRSPGIILKDIKMAMHYFTANQAHGYKQLFYDFAHQFYILHVLLPFVAIAACIYIVVTLRKQPHHIFRERNFLLLSSLFLFLLFFANLQRALVRHGYAERGEFILTSTFFLALGLLMAYRLRSNQPAVQAASFFVAMFFSFFVVIFFPYKPDYTPLESAITRNSLRDIDYDLYSDTYRGRMKPDTGATYESIVAVRAFLDRHLNPDQTFLDFSNTPMLYYYCNRESPGYFCQNLQNSVDDYLQMELVKQVPTEKVPVVVFASYPRNNQDHIEGVPNAIRHYIVAEYIFKHYKPYGIVGDKSIWVAHTMPDPPPGTPVDTMIGKDPNQLNLLPEYTGAFYAEEEHARNLQMVYAKNEKEFGLHHDSLNLMLEQNILRLEHCYLAIDFKKQEAFDPYQMEIRFIDTAGTQVGSIPFIRRDKVSSRYMIRLSNYPFWYQHAVLEIGIANADEIEKISILKDLRFENQATAHH